MLFDFPLLRPCLKYRKLLELVSLDEIAFFVGLFSPFVFGSLGFFDLCGLKYDSGCE